MIIFLGHVKTQTLSKLISFWMNVLWEQGPHLGRQLGQLRLTASLHNMKLYIKNIYQEHSTRLATTRLSVLVFKEFISSEPSASQFGSHGPKTPAAIRVDVNDSRLFSPGSQQRHRHPQGGGSTAASLPHLMRRLP